MSVQSSSEGTQFAIALPPDYYYNHGIELLINAREQTDVTITNSSSSEVITVYGEWSLAYRIPADMRMNKTAEVEDKGNMS